MKGKAYRILFLVFVGAGVFFGGLWGLPPGYLIDMGLKPMDPGQSGKAVWYFILFCTFYGALSLVLLFFWLIVEGFWAPLKKRRLRQKILSAYFGNGERRTGYDTFRKLTGVTEEEMRRIFGERKSDFNYQDYQKAAAYLKGIGVRIEDRPLPEEPARQA